MDAKKIIATGVYEGRAVYVLAITDTEIMVSPIVSERGEVLFAKPNEVSQLLPMNYQGITKELPKITKELPGDYQTVTTPGTANYQGDTTKARAALPTPPSLVELIDERWPILVALQQADYSGTQVRNFEELVQKIEQGELSVVPRPIYASVAEAIGDGKDRRLIIARTVKSFAEYRSKHYPSRPWLILNEALNKVDELLTYLVRIA